MSPSQVRRWLEEELQEAEIRSRYWRWRRFLALERMWSTRAATLTLMLAQLPRDAGS